MNTTESRRVRDGRRLVQVWCARCGIDAMDFRR
jgi:hypothetical protein